MFVCTAGWCKRTVLTSVLRILLYQYRRIRASRDTIPGHGWGLSWFTGITMRDCIRHSAYPEKSHKNWVRPLLFCLGQTKKKTAAPDTFGMLNTHDRCKHILRKRDSPVCAAHRGGSGRCQQRCPLFASPAKIRKPGRERWPTHKLLAHTQHVLCLCLTESGSGLAFSTVVLSYPCSSASSLAHNVITWPMVSLFGPARRTSTRFSASRLCVK